MTRKAFNDVSPKTQQLRTRWAKYGQTHKLFIKIRVSREEKERYKELGKRHPKGVSGLIREYLESLVPTNLESVPTNVVPTPTDRNPDTEGSIHLLTDPDTEAHTHSRTGSSSATLVSIPLTTPDQHLLDKEWDTWFSNLLPEHKAQALEAKARRAARRAGAAL